MKQNTIEEAVLNVLIRWDKVERGWWFGYDDLFDDLEIFHKCRPTLQEVKAALKALRQKGQVRVSQIFSEDGKLNGSGYFYIYPSKSNP